MDSIKSFLVDYLKKKINFVKKKAFSNFFVSFGNSDEVVLFRNVLNKEYFTNDDINDLLICFSDHVMDDYELLEFVSNNSYVFYEMDEATTNMDIRNIIIFYLLQSNDLNIVLGVFKLFSISVLEMLDDKDISLYGGLEYGNTLYDLYNCYVGIINEENIELRRKKAISFMSLFNIDIFKEEFKKLGISFDDIESFTNDYEKEHVMSEACILRLLNNMLLIEDRILGDNELLKEVLTCYKSYIENHVVFNLDEFIKFYNYYFNRDFSSFFYNKKKVLLDVNLLYSILNRSTNVDSFSLYGEYLDIFKSLNNVKKNYVGQVDSFKKGIKEKEDSRNEVLSLYGEYIDKLKNPINVTLKYYIYLNIPEEYRDTFYEIIKWYYDNNNDFFGRNVFAESDDIKKNTFDMILAECKERILEDFKHRKAIHKDYLCLVKKMIGSKYITIKNWNEYLYVIYREYYCKEGLLHISEMLKLVNMGRSLLEYQEENFEYSEFKFMCTAVKLQYPDMSLDIDNLYELLSKEKEEAILLSRNYVDELILFRHATIIREFVDSECISRKHFLNVTGISDLRFDRAVNVVREQDHELYELYRMKIMKSLNRKFYFDENGLSKK